MQPPTATWGNMLANAQDRMARYPWMAIFPGLMIFLTTISINYIGDGLALDTIAKVGPGRHYLAQKHTRRHLRDIWIPQLTQPRPSMYGTPPPDIRQRARAEVDRILTEHEPEPLDEAVQAELRGILDAAEREFDVHL